MNQHLRAGGSVEDYGAYIWTQGGDSYLENLFVKEHA